jgi:hypothetical protein
MHFSSDVFKMFKAEDGTFSEDVTNKPKELLCLYNAAYTLTHGEPELEEIISFARHHLESLVPSLSTPLVEQVKRSLHIPLPRTYKRLEALRYMPEYEQEEGHNAILLELAKLEFNLLQRVHLKELKDISEYAHTSTCMDYLIYWFTFLYYISLYSLINIISYIVFSGGGMIFRMTSS